jgi:formylglycine-generating enzyme required for sulfatase activity
MAGNVQEWTADWHARDYYQRSPLANPTGPDSGVTRVVRGGAWSSEPLFISATVRRDFLPESFDSSLGFRCVSSTFPPVPAGP